MLLDREKREARKRVREEGDDEVVPAKKKQSTLPVFKPLARHEEANPKPSTSKVLKNKVKVAPDVPVVRASTADTSTTPSTTTIQFENMKQKYMVIPFFYLDE